MFSYPSSVIIGDVSPYTQALATLNQTVFGTNWTANASSDVVVYQTPAGSPPNDVTQILSQSLYNVAFIGAQQEVQVTLNTGAGAGDIITITRQTPASRENLYTNTNFLPSMLNNDFGILTLVDQQAQLVNQLIGPRYNYSAIIQDVIDTILPILPANNVWMKNSNNTGIIAVPIPTGSVPGGGAINPGLINQLAWYAASGTTISGLPTIDNGVMITSPLGVPEWLNPANNSVFVTNGSGVPSWETTFPIGLTIPSPLISYSNGQNIKDNNGNTLVQWGVVASAVNFVIIANSVTNSPAIISVSGSDTNVGLQLQGKGIGGVATEGVGTNNSAAAGYVGELISSVIISGSAISVSMTATPQNLTSILLTPGDWDLWANIFYTPSGDNLANVFAGINSISSTLPDNSILSEISNPTAFGNTGLTAPQIRVSIASNTTYYIVGQCAFGAGTVTMCGGIYARRRR